MKDRADLHTHSVFSDGQETPTRIVQIAEQTGLGGIALTDHDTIDGLREFMRVSVGRDMHRVPGLEISTDYGKKSAHLLGFFVPRNSLTLESKLRWLREEREKRFTKMLDRMKDELGLVPSREYIRNLLKHVDSPGRPHMGRILIDHGIVQDMDEAFQKYLHSGGPLYVRKVKLDLQEGINLLRNAGAVPVLAHPLDIKVDSITQSLAELKEMGILGVEVNYDYSNIKILEDPRVVVDATKNLDLIGTGGSDYHGTGWRASIGSVSVPIEVIGALREAARELGNDLCSWNG